MGARLYRTEAVTDPKPQPPFNRTDALVSSCRAFCLLPLWLNKMMLISTRYSTKIYRVYDYMFSGCEDLKQLKKLCYCSKALL